MKNATLICLLSALMLALSVTTSAQEASFDQNVITGMEWRNIGPNRGGRSLGISGSPGRKNEYYFGAVGGGLWKTVDGGLNWNPVTDGQLTSSSVGAVAVAETNPDVVYIGTGETQLRGNIMQGDGVYKSVDAGETWENVGLKDTQAIARVRVHPTDPDTVYVAALGHPYGANKERGVFRSKDGGASWKKVLYLSDKAGAADLIIDRRNPDTLYATIWQVYRTPWKMWGGAGDSGLFKSTDGGDTWEELTDNPGMAEAPVGKIGITVSPVDSDRLWAIVESAEGGVFRSDDAGATWSRTNSERKLRQRAFYYSRIYADPKDADTVYALNTGFYKSTDGGETFETTIKVPHGDNHDLWIDPSNPLRMANSNDGGGNISINGGESWTDQNFPTSQLYHIMVTSDFPYHVCGAQQDNSTLCIPNEGWDFKQARGPSQEYYYPAGGGESGYIAQHPDKPDWFYAGSQGALLTKFNRATGYQRDVQVFPRFFSGEPASALPERWQWTFPIVFSPVDSSRLYTTSQHVWISEDEGQSWSKMSPDLTYAEPETMGKTGGVITNDMNGPEIYATVFALEPSQHDVDTIWAGSDDGLMHITRNHGESWENITPKDLPKHSRISIIDESAHSPGTAYIAVKRYQMDDRKPYIWKTDDYGKSWTKIVKGIRKDDFIHVVREDPFKAGLLFAGGEHAVYVSFDDGENWHSLQLNMPDTQTADLHVTEKDLVVGTHGRSIYVLDDIAPLREYSSEIAAAKFHLFEPLYAVRRVQEASIQYYLAEEAEEVRISVIDSQGNVIVEKTGTEPELEEVDDPYAQWYGALPKDPTTAKGLNVWSWNNRYAGAADFEGMIIWSGRPQLGPIAPPGEYTVTMTVDGDTQSATFMLKSDPRFDVPEADIQEQFAFAMQIRDATDAANKGVIRIRELKTQLEDQLGEAPSKSLARAAEKFTDKLSAVEGELYQVKNVSPQDPLNFPIKLNNRLAYLQKSTESGDGRPTQGQLDVFALLKDELDSLLADLDETISKDLPKLNKALEKDGLESLGDD
ncbi:WD40/YVTN/BNR-like repeat-containing protein [Congregibacter sp.]|uniref:WD40/YVTN/BNR-like repeat-containing protein n=1 Tax=Congregibacter sp. TaxID=2744308 RepID=UPI003858510A